MKIENPVTRFNWELLACWTALVVVTTAVAHRPTLFPLYFGVNYWMAWAVVRDRRRTIAILKAQAVVIDQANTILRKTHAYRTK